jgi:hypothetical protein
MCAVACRNSPAMTVPTQRVPDWTCGQLPCGGELIVALPRWVATACVRHAHPFDTHVGQNIGGAPANASLQTGNLPTSAGYVFGAGGNIHLYGARCLPRHVEHGNLVLESEFRTLVADQYTTYSARVSNREIAGSSIETHQRNTELHGCRRLPSGAACHSQRPIDRAVFSYRPGLRADAPLSTRSRRTSRKAKPQSGVS